MTAVSLGIVVVIAAVVLVTEGRGFDSTWWTFAIIGVAVLTAGLLGRARFGRALRSARRPLD